MKTGLSSAERCVIELIRHAFPFDEDAPCAPQISPSAWLSIAQAADENALGPLLYVSLQKSRREHELPADALARLRWSYLRSSVANWQAFQELERLLGCFDRERIPVILLKGCALVPMLYDDAALRPMADLDLMVPRETLTRARALLLARGYAESSELAPGFADRFSYHLHFHSARQGATVEIHGHLFKSPYYFQRIPMDWFWTRTREIQLNGRRVSVLAPEAQFLHLSTHFVLHHRAQRLIWSYDLARWLTRACARMDWGEVIAAARRFGLSLPIQIALSCVRETWGVGAPAEVAARLNALRPTAE
jgi:hypothetical protein